MNIVVGVILTALFFGAGFLGRGAWIWVELARQGCTVELNPEIQAYIQREFRARKQADPSVQFEARMVEIERLAVRAEEVVKENDELIKKMVSRFQRRTKL